MRIGLVGTGFVVNDFHMPAFRAIGDLAEVVAVAGRDETRTRDFARRWGIKDFYYGDACVESLCKNDSIDVVDVASANDLHLSAIATASEHHKDVICEKPLARDAEEAKQALSAAQRYGVVHCYAENQVFIPQVVRAKKFVEGGDLGKIAWVRSREAHSGPHRRWFRERARSGGGVLLDMGCHSIEVSRYLMDKTEPSTVLGWTATLAPSAEVEDNSLVLIKYEGGSLSQSENSWSAKGGLDIRLEMYGSEGSIFIDTTRETGLRVFTMPSHDKSGYIVEKADASSGWMYPAWDEYVTHGYVNELRHFCESISADKKPIETFEDGATVNKLIDTAYRSSNESRWISVDH